MNGPTQSQLDDFARRLRGLETELGELRRLAATPAPPLATPPVPSEAPYADDASARRLLDAGRIGEAVTEIERRRVLAVDAGSVGALRELLELARSAAATGTWPAAGSAGRLAYLIERNLEALGSSATDPAVARSDSAPAAGTPAVEQPRRLGEGRAAPSGLPLLPRGGAAPPAEPTASAQPPPAPEEPRRPPFSRLPELQVPDLLGPRALALAGGVVTLLGIVFFFVLAVNRGWIGPEGRVALAAAASLVVFLGGLELHRRYGETYSSLAAVGAGIAGGYATVLAAAALYGLLPDAAALATAAAVAAVGVATSIAWRSQIVAGLGLVGAMLVPVAVVAQEGPSPLGTAFVAIVLAATGVVALRFGWRSLLVAGVLVSAPQILALVLAPEHRSGSPWPVIALAAAFSFLYAAIGVASRLRSDRPGAIDALTASLVSGAGALAALSARVLLGTPGAEGLGVLAAAGAYALAAAFFLIRRPERDLSALLAAVAIVLGGIGLADVLSGDTLAYAWAAEAAALAWLARRTREPRFQLWAAVYLVLCAGHVLLVEAPPTSLLVASPDTAGAAAAAAVALAAGVFGFYARPWPDRVEPLGGVFAPADALAARAREEQAWQRGAAFWLGGAFAALGASLAAISLFSSFDWAFVAVTAIWSLAGLGIAAAGMHSGSGQARRGAAAWLATVTLVVVGHAESVSATPRWWSLLVLAAALFATGLACVLLDRGAGGTTMDAAACTAAAAVALAAAGTAGLLDGQALACTWAAGAAALAWCARRLRAQHLLAVAALPLGLAAGHALGIDAPPRQLLAPTGDPAAGVFTLLALVAAAGAIAAQLRAWKPERSYGELAGAMSAVAHNRPALRDGSLWLGGVLATYAASLLTLALAGDFDGGWVAVSAISCSLGLGLLAAGLRPGSAELRRGGLVWLASVTSVVVVEGAAALGEGPRCAAYLIAATALLAAGVAYGVGAGREELTPVTLSSTLASLALSWYAIAALLDGATVAVDREGAGLLTLALLYVAIAAALLRWTARRDPATLYLVVALVLGVATGARLLDGTWFVLGFAAAAVLLAWLSARAREPRFRAGALAYLALALASALAAEAPPADLFAARTDPGAGAPAVLVVGAALAAVARFARRERGLRATAFAAEWWLAGMLAVYGLSLAILQLAESAFDTDLQAEFQRGHTAVSAFWGLLGLVLLYAGLTRWRSLRLAGLALFAVSLGKIFLFDLPSLSSIERALSFLAVGAVLLLGGFFYQRLSTEGPGRTAQ